MKPIPISIKSFKQFREAVYAFRLPRIIFSALDLNLFTKMNDRVWTIPELAKRVRVSQRGLAILCRNLASVGLLVKSQSGYRLAPFSKRYLQESSRDFQGDYLALMQRQWSEWSHLTEVIRVGQPLDSQEPETTEYRRSFSWAMHHRSIQPAREVAQQISLKADRTLLDLGGGPGTYALAFLAQNPTLHVTVMDRPAALDVARTLAEQSSLGSRLTYQAGDFLTARISGTYDVVWYSNVLHIYSPADNLKIFKKIKRILNPGGRLLIQDTFLQDPNELQPLEANLFAVSMLLYTQRGNTYSVRNVREWLQRAGLTHSRLLHLKKGTGDWEGQLVEGRLPRSG
ncbi:class I SAM-dependent methyltransferase [Candidatus Nitrospira allomarina]|uniref:Class I SAM-dependent methyltransferase n=1 Tax=Candidatus Nitrospira allomarina TaxID=3020900 RepID=A0AA96G9Z7_9BACT|nr:class I SAM-dependent methyltransferase [Candidatus Nitrospira allomarina]WNM57187.1 class I SAM-dependent methyltransferase [Candidatus Nitrospira allomarina]